MKDGEGIPGAKAFGFGLGRDQKSLRGPHKDDAFKGDILSPDPPVRVSGPQNPGWQPQEAREAAGHLGHLVRLLRRGADGQHRAGVLSLRVGTALQAPRRSSATRPRQTGDWACAPPPAPALPRLWLELSPLRHAVTPGSFETCGFQLAARGSAVQPGPKAARGCPRGAGRVILGVWGGLGSEVVPQPAMLPLPAGPLPCPGTAQTGFQGTSWHGSRLAELAGATLVLH